MIVMSHFVSLIVSCAGAALASAAAPAPRNLRRDTELIGLLSPNPA